MSIWDSYKSFYEPQKWGRGDDPTKNAQRYIDQIPGTVKPYYDPYVQAGGQSRDELMDQYHQLTEDPDAVYNKIGQGYQESPGYQFQLQQALSAGNNAAAAGGMVGSPTHSQNQMQVAQGLAAQDYDKYFENAMGLYGKGIGGYEGMNEMGFNASNELAQILGNQWKSKANLDLAGRGMQDAKQQAFWGNVSGLGHDAAKMYGMGGA